MILDTSAVLAILFREASFAGLVDKLLAADTVGIGAPTLVEASLVLTGKLDRDPRVLLGWFLQEFRVETVPFGEAHWRVAMDAFRRFGKGRHPAALNFGDCLSYATARLAASPLLATGNDFARTDLELA